MAFGALASGRRRSPLVFSVPSAAHHLVSVVFEVLLAASKVLLAEVLLLVASEAEVLLEVSETEVLLEVAEAEVLLELSRELARHGLPLVASEKLGHGLLGPGLLANDDDATFERMIVVSAACLADHRM